MDPQYEQRLRDEVIYLHSLWHQGPPRASGASGNHLQPLKTTQFKKVNKHIGRKWGKPENKPENSLPDSNSDPGPEWPCASPPPPCTTWENLVAQPDPKPLSLTPEEQSKLAAKHAQQHAVKAVLEFLKGDDTDGSDSIDSSSDEDDELMEEDDGREEYSFFCKLFMEDAELREHYKKNFAEGEFSCLVCGAVGGKKTGKKFKGCPALIQHSITISKTKKRRAHRAFGQAVCKVLGWDIDQLSAIVSSLSDKSGVMQGSVNIENRESADTIVSSNVCPVQSNPSKVGPESESICNGVSPSGGDGDMDSSTCPDGDNNIEDLGMLHPHNVQKPTAADVMIELSTSTCPNGDNNIEDLGIPRPCNVEEPAAKGPMIESFTCPGSDDTIKDPGMPRPHEVENPAAAEPLLINSLTSQSPDGDKNIGGVDMPSPHNVEESAADGLMTVSSTFHVGDSNIEDRGMLREHKVEEPAAEGPMSNSLAYPDGDNLEDFAGLSPLNVKEPAVWGSD